MSFVLPAPTGLTGWGDSFMELALTLRAEKIEKQKMKEEKEYRAEVLRLQEKGLDSETAARQAQQALAERAQAHTENVDFERIDLERAGQSLREDIFGFDVEDRDRRFGLESRQTEASIGSSNAYAKMMGVQTDAASLQLEFDRDTRELRRQIEVSRARGAKTEADAVEIELAAKMTLGPEGIAELMSSKHEIAAMQAQRYAQQAELSALNQQLQLFGLGMKMRDEQEQRIQQTFDNWTGSGSLTKDLLPADRIEINDLFMNAARSANGPKTDPNAIAQLREAAYDKVRKAEDRKSKMELATRESTTNLQTWKEVIVQSATKTPEEWDSKSLREWKTSGAEVRPIDSKSIFNIVGVKPASKYVYYTKTQAEARNLGAAWNAAPSSTDRFLDITSGAVGPAGMQNNDLQSIVERDMSQ